jgi:hypothetical protein
MCFAAGKPLVIEPFSARNATETRQLQESQVTRLFERHRFAVIELPDVIFRTRISLTEFLRSCGTLAALPRRPFTSPRRHFVRSIDIMHRRRHVSAERSDGGNLADAIAASSTSSSIAA